MWEDLLLSCKKQNSYQSARIPNTRYPKMDPTNRENLAMWTFHAESHTRLHCWETDGRWENVCWVTNMRVKDQCEIFYLPLYLVCLIYRALLLTPMLLFDHWHIVIHILKMTTYRGILKTTDLDFILVAFSRFTIPPKQYTTTDS